MSGFLWMYLGKTVQKGKIAGGTAKDAWEKNYLRKRLKLLKLKPIIDLVGVRVSKQEIIDEIANAVNRVHRKASSDPEAKFMFTLKLEQIMGRENPLNTPNFAQFMVKAENDLLG